MRLHAHVGMRGRGTENPAGACPRYIASRPGRKGVLREKGQIQMAEFARSSDPGGPEATDHEHTEFGPIMTVLVRPEQSHDRTLTTASDRTRH